MEPVINSSKRTVPVLVLLLLSLNGCMKETSESDPQVSLTSGRAKGSVQVFMILAASPYPWLNYTTTQQAFESPRSKPSVPALRRLRAPPGY